MINKIDYFDDMFLYEKSRENIFSFIKNVLFLFLIIIKQSIFKRRKIYYYLNEGSYIFINERSYLYKPSAISVVLGKSFDVISMEKLQLEQKSRAVIDVGYQPLRQILYFAKCVIKRKCTAFSALSVLRGSIKYSFLFDKEFKKQFNSIIAHYEIVALSDPANPFIKFLKQSFKGRIKYICTTMIAPHSKEWTAIDEKEIFVVGNKSIYDSFFNIYDKEVVYLNYEKEVLRLDKYKFRILFIQQYYHPLAFNGRVRHFFANLRICQQPGVLTRLHPNERIPEILIYRILASFGFIVINNNSFEIDAMKCRFAITFTSSALSEFTLYTGRPGRYLKSSHLRWKVQ